MSPNRILFISIITAFLITCIIYLLARPKANSRKPVAISRSANDYFRTVYNEPLSMPLKVVKQLEDSINFVWDTVPDDLLNKYIAPNNIMPPEYGQLYRWNISSGFYINRHIPEDYNNYREKFPQYFMPNTWVEVSHACFTPPNCEYPICDEIGYWGVIAPGSGLFLSTGDAPLVSLNKISACHTLLVQSGESPEKAWYQMGTLLDKQPPTWKFMDMRRNTTSFTKSSLFLLILGICLGFALGVYAIMVPFIDKNAQIIQSIVGGMLAVVCMYGASRMINPSVMYSVQQVKQKLNLSTVQLLKQAAFHNNRVASGLAITNIYDRQMACLAKKDRRTMIMLSSQPTSVGSWLPVYCNLTNFSVSDSGICEIPTNFSQGLCSNFIFIMGPMTKEWVPTQTCSCCESKDMVCAGCLGHLSYTLCKQRPTDEINCLALLPPGSSCT